MNLNEVIQTNSILIEVIELFDDNFKAVCVAVEDLSDGYTIKQIEKDLSVSNWSKYEPALIKCAELYRNEILKYQAYSNIDYSECRRILESTANYIRLNDFRMKNTKQELLNLESIIEYAKDLHTMISKISGKETKYKKRWMQPTLFGD